MKTILKTSTIAALTLLLMISTSCMTTYDRSGRPVKSVHPVAAVSVAAATGLIGYNMGRNSNSSSNRGYGYGNYGGYSNYGYGYDSDSNSKMKRRLRAQETYGSYNTYAPYSDSKMKQRLRAQDPYRYF